MLKDFKAFVMRGNVLDLAVAVIIGAAFGKIVTSLTEDIIMPVIGKITGGLDFSSYFLRLGPIPADYRGSPTDYAALKKAGAPLLGYGQFATQAVSFLIVRTVTRVTAVIESEKVAVVPAEPADVALLREIRDELRARR